MSSGVEAGILDTTIPFAYVTLAAVSEGLGTCWLGAFNQDAVKNILGVPADALVLGMTPLGYPAKNPSPTPRKAFEDVVGFEGW